MQPNGNSYWDQLIDAHQDRLFRIAYRGVGDWHLAEDLVQDTIMTALLKKEEFTRHPNPGAFLTQTLNYKINNELRRHYHTETPYDDSLAPHADGFDVGLLEVLPEKLAEGEKQILIWRYQYDMSYREIANRLGISEDGSRSRVCRIRDKCRQLLGNPKK